MPKLTIVNPVAAPKGTEVDATTFALAPRPTRLDGKTIGLFWNGKNNGDDALRSTETVLRERFDDITVVHYLGDKGGLTRFASEDLQARIVREVDVVIGTSADCGSCTSWLIRDMAALERAGLPTMALTATGFVNDAHWSAEVFGCVDLAITEVPLPFTNQDPVAIDQMVRDAFDTIVGGLVERPTPDDRVLVTRPPELDIPTEITFTYEGADLLECSRSMGQHFIEQGWSDGLPLVPPTPELVADMVAASRRDGDEVIGVFAPGNGLGTVEKIAANAVMAGAPPSAMPVILAVAECILDPAIGLRTFAMSTGPQAPVIMVSGPVATEVGMNSGVCALGPASQSAVNVTIGRTLRLMMMNVGHAYPGLSDMDTIGSPIKFSACVAENEAANPFPPFRVEQGFAAEQSTVTVNVPYGMCELFDFQSTDPEGLIESYATVTRNVASSPSPGVWLIKAPADPNAGYPFNGVYQNLIMMCPEHADVFARAGWTTEDIRVELHRRSRLPFEQAMTNKPMPLFEASNPQLQFLLDQPETPVSLYPSPDCFQVFVVGAVAGRSLYFHGGTVSVTKPIATP